MTNKTASLEQEVAQATGLTRKEGESAQDWYARLAKAASGLEDDKWEELSEPAQAWMNKCVAAVKEKGTLPGPGDGEAEADEEKEPPAKDADEDSDDDADADEPAKDKDAPDEDAEPAADDDDEDSDDDEPPAKKKTESDDADDEDDDAGDDSDDDDEEDAKPAKRERLGDSEKASKNSKTKPTKEKKTVEKTTTKKAKPKSGAPRGRGVGKRLRRMILRHPDWTRDQIATKMKDTGHEVSERTVHTTHYAVHSTLRSLAEYDPPYYHGGKAAWVKKGGDAEE